MNIEHRWVIHYALHEVERELFINNLRVPKDDVELLTDRQGNLNELAAKIWLQARLYWMFLRPAFRRPVRAEGTRLNKVAMGLLIAYQH